MSITEESPRPGLLATMTERRFLAHLRESDVPLSRSEIAQISGISKPAISDAARRLEESGVIVSAGVREGRRGGVAALYEINANRGHSISLALDSAFVAARAVRLNGSLASEASEPLPQNASSDHVINVAKRVLATLADDAGSPLLAAAISVADPVDKTTGDIITLVDSVFPAGHFNPVRDLDIQATQVKVDNDVNWATLAEHDVGTMGGEDDFLYIHLGAGLGAGLFVGGNLQRGARGLSGEIGHLRLPSGENLTRALTRLGFGYPGPVFGLDVDASSALICAPAMAPATQEALDLLAMAIANMVTLLNSTTVVLGGPLAELAPLEAHLSRTIPRFCLDQVSVMRGTRSALDGASHEAHRLAMEGLGF